jgi:hypothetical protein
VHTIGTLLEGGQYKEKLKSGDLLGLVNSFLGGSGNPLDEQRSKSSYETMNRDTGAPFLPYGHVLLIPWTS